MLIVGAAAAAAGLVLSTVSCGSSGGGRFSCPDQNTCCPRSDGSFGCVPSEASETGQAVCCDGGALACPVNYTCSANQTRRVGGMASLTCLSKSGRQYDPELSEGWPYPMGMAGWQLPYHTCPAFDGPPPLFSLPLGIATGDLVFPYYSNVGELGSSGHEDVEVVLIVQHGANRNADDYFCSGIRAASLWLNQHQHGSEKIAVVAPRFMELQDSPPAKTVWWNGSFPVGYWRAGAESDPSASPVNATVSSFKILDIMVEAFLGSKSAYPNLRRVVIAGHSSGGQIVQRHSLFTHLPTADKSIGSGKAKTLPTVRHAVANPSSFAYLDERRWLNGTLRSLTPSEKAACPLFDDWQFGFASGLPPYCAGMNASAAVAAAIAAYPARDVVYLQGYNDTCNEQDIPGCVSHGLETTCMDMLEGRFRLERGKQYFEYLKEFYGRPVHSLAVVPNVGHDHSLIWDGALEHIFA